MSQVGRWWRPALTRGMSGKRPARRTRMVASSTPHAMLLDKPDACHPPPMTHRVAASIAYAAVLVAFASLGVIGLAVALSLAFSHQSVRGAASVLPCPNGIEVEYTRSFGVTRTRLWSLGASYPEHKPRELVAWSALCNARGGINAPSEEVWSGWPFRFAYGCSITHRVFAETSYGRVTQNKLERVGGIAWNGNLLPGRLDSRGFLANVALFACGGFGLQKGVLFARRCRRRARGQCSMCGYPLNGGKCPECGCGEWPASGYDQQHVLQASGPAN